MLLDAGKSSLLLIDVQERLLPAMHSPELVVRHAAILLNAAATLQVPVTVSEQYPRGLGHTVPELIAPDANVWRFEKLAFSCWRDRPLANHLIGLHEAGRPQVILAGIEAHVCVLQSAIDLVMAGFAVFAVADAMSSRRPSSAEVACERMRANGVQVITTEMAVFELLGQAGTPVFKALSALVK
jgi:nicotinamidase-related amidase